MTFTLETHLGLEKTLQIARVRVDPRDPNFVYVAALGEAWGPTAIDSKLAWLLNFASMGDAPPTDGARQLFAGLSQGVFERASAVDVMELSGR
ncbi:MAG: hypothetical protein E2P02_02925 [Acidobacteria bacterium]|nr:MAG: hypothetical protein E2P02_02925 [Acidobacteriota bacterium]